MGESLRSQLFINSEQVGDFIDVTLPASGDEEEGEIARIHYLEAGVGEPLLLIHLNRTVALHLEKCVCRTFGQLPRHRN